MLDACQVLYIVNRQKIKRKLGRLASKAFTSNQHPRKPITTFQAPSIDRLHGHLGLPFGDHDSQIAVPLETGTLWVLDDGIVELRRLCELDRS